MASQTTVYKTENGRTVKVEPENEKASSEKKKTGDVDKTKRPSESTLEKQGD